jgi:acetyl esterase/lipase
MDLGKPTRVLRAGVAAALVGVALLAAGPASADHVTVRQLIGVPYAPAMPPGSNGHLLNLYLPEGVGTPLPVLIWNQGSAWMSDNGRSGAPWQQFTEAGYAVVGMSIRSSSQVTFPGQLCDTKAAIRFLRQHADEYGLDSGRFAIMGFSSGGWTAAIAGTSGGIPDPACDFALPDPTLYSDRVQAAIPLHPPTDFLEMNAACLPSPEAPQNWALDPEDYPPCVGVIDHDGSNSPESRLMGCAIQTCPDKVRSANPITYVTPDDPPFLIMHGMQDSLVPYNQSARLFDALSGACLDATLYSLPGHNHETLYLGNPNAAPGYTVKESRSCATRSLTQLDAPPPTYDTIIQFLDRVLVPTEKGEGGKATGGGWLADGNGKKLNFGFDVEDTASGPEGDLQLNDRTANAKIDLSQVTFVGPVGDGCGSVAEAPTSLELRGTGTYNGTAAEFRVCVQDNGEGSSGVGDLFHLECEAGCSYDTRSRVADEAVDGGNIQVERSSDGSSSSHTAGEQQASTLILDPVLLTAGGAGADQTLSVRAYGPDQEQLGGISVTLTQVGEAGVIETFAALTDPTGVARFSVTNLVGRAEYVATVGSVQSNAIEVMPIAS